MSPEKPLLQPALDEDDRLPGQPALWLGMMVAAAFVGALSGALGAAFRWTLEWVVVWRTKLVELVHASLPPDVGWAVPVACCAASTALALWLTQRFAPAAAGSGIPRVEAVLRERLNPAAGRMIPVKFIGGVLSIGAGLALGREGPTVQMGGTVGRLVSRLLHRFLAEPWTLIAAGAGAGLAVAFNAPLAATLFVMEELLHRFSSRVFSATLIACIASTIVSRSLLGSATIFIVPTLGSIPADVLPAYLLLGLTCGALGVAFNRLLLAALDGFDGLPRWPRGAKGATVGVAAGLLLFFAPRMAGGGEALGQLAISHSLALGALCTLLSVRLIFTLASYGCGSPGGIFAPLLALGALTGSAFAHVSLELTRAPLDPTACSVVAMAALFTAVVRSPLTGVILLLEMTGSWTLILPMMAAALAAFVVPELLSIPPIYDSLRARDDRRPWPTTRAWTHKA